MPRKRKQRGKELIRELKQDVKDFEQMADELLEERFEVIASLSRANDRISVLENQQQNQQNKEPTDLW